MTSPTKNARAAWLEGPSVVCPAPPEVARRWRLILLGAPGVGKGTQADLLRQRLAPATSPPGTSSARPPAEVHVTKPGHDRPLDFMRRGALVPDSTVWEMVHKRSACLRCRGGFILDGFPRTLAQAECLKHLMEDERLRLAAVVNYELPLAEIVERLSGRRTCEQCKAVYHVTRQPSQTAGACDRCGGHLFQREDDRPESVTVRMEAYERSPAPLIEFYGNLGLLLPVAATGSPAEICARTVTTLEARAHNRGEGIERRSIRRA
jgi:adenylate kinase